LALNIKFKRERAIPAGRRSARLLSLCCTQNHISKYKQRLSEQVQFDTRVILSKSILSKSILSKSILRKSILSKSILSKSILSKSILSKSILSKSILSKFILSKSGSDKMTILTKSILSKSCDSLWKECVRALTSERRQDQTRRTRGS
jgi:hypothetical protein